MKKQGIIALMSLMVMLMLVSAPVLAQGPPPPVSSAPDSIDGGISILLIGAAVYGYYKLKQAEKATA